MVFNNCWTDFWGERYSEGYGSGWNRTYCRGLFPLYASVGICLCGKNTWRITRGIGGYYRICGCVPYIAKNYRMGYVGNAVRVHNDFSSSCNLESADALRMLRRSNPSDALADFHKKYCTNGNAIVCIISIKKIILY